MPATDVALPPHNAHCFGCGGHNSVALGLTFRQVGDHVVATVTLDRRHQGAPGLAHGGVVSAILDEAAGTVTYALREPAVTAQLNVSFKAPVPLHRPLTVAATLTRRTGRKLFIEITLDLDGTPVATADALFLTVSPSHFHNNGAAPGEIPALGV